MKIGEIARSAGVTTSRIRFYEKRGIIPPAERGENGYRDYPAELVGLLGFIEQAQELGFTLREVAAVRESMAARPSDSAHPVPCETALALLSDKLAAVEALITQAQSRKARIEELIAELQVNHVGETYSPNVAAA